MAHDAHDAQDAESFDSFCAVAESRLRQSLSAVLGSEAGREAAVDAMSYAWEHWERVRSMDNPIGYLFVVGRNRGRRQLRRRRPTLLRVDHARTPWVEPGLPDALGRLAETQRVVVLLLHGFEWSMTEVADLLGVSKSTVQTHAERGIERLRAELGVTL